MKRFESNPAPTARRAGNVVALAAALALSTLLQACGTTPAADRPVADTSRRAGQPGNTYATAAPAARRYDIVGVASWYGKPYHGRRTASGEVFNMYQMTAAHPSLPFGTRVVITNLDNGRSAVVRINDRGPFVGGRVIDVSRKAASQLGFLGKGLTRVGVRVVSSSRG
jgi:rare lipoprotein A